MEHLVPTLEGNAGRRALLSKDAGIVECNIKSAELCDSAACKRLRKLFITDVARECDGFAAVARNFAYEAVKLCVERRQRLSRPTERIRVLSIYRCLNWRPLLWRLCL